MKKYYLLSLISASLIGATCIQCTSPKQKSGENTLPQKSELFVSLPDYCPTPDGMAIAPNGDLILACPNFADITQPACLMRITKDGAVSKWLDVPVLEETGWASPMGLAFNEEGDLFISDNQGWSGAEKAKNKGRVLRLKFENDQLKETITVASGMEHPNGIRIRNGKLYVTQSSLSQIKDPSGLLVSGVYCFDMNDRDIAVTNTSADQNLLTTVITKNWMESCLTKRVTFLWVTSVTALSIVSRWTQKEKLSATMSGHRIRLSFVPQTVCVSTIKEIFG